MSYRTTLRGRCYSFTGLRELMAKASPHRSGDVLAGLAATSAAERAAAQIVLADVPLTTFLEDLLIPYEDDDVTRLIVDTHEVRAFAAVSHLQQISLFRAQAQCRKVSQIRQATRLVLGAAPAPG